MTPEATEAIRALTQAVQALGDSIASQSTPTYVVGATAGLLTACLVVWLTATFALRRDKATWVKDAEQHTLQQCMDRAGEVINWANGVTPHYPYLPLTYLQLDLISLGATALLPDLKALRAKAADLHKLGIEKKLPDAELQAKSRDFIGDVIYLGVKLQHHVRKSIGLPVYPVPTRQEIDA